MAELDALPFYCTHERVIDVDYFFLPVRQQHHESRWPGGPCPSRSPPLPDTATRLVRAVVLLSVRVRGDGSVAEVTVLSESSPGFGAAAQACAQQDGKFEPARDASGAPVSDTVVLRIRHAR
jgi:hypothetical protein